MPSAASSEPSRELSTERRTNSWDRKCKAVVYDPSLHELKTERCEKLGRTLLPELIEPEPDSPDQFDSFEVPLPRWRNRVDIYMDPGARAGFVATVKLDKLKWTKNWQRRLRHNYTVLHVQGSKPGDMSRTSSRSTASMSVGK